MDDITKAIADGEGIEVGAKRALLRFAVQRQIFCPYTGAVLDVRKAVLLDGSDHGKKMHIMTADAFDLVMSAGFDTSDYEVLDGRTLFK